MAHSHDQTLLTKFGFLDPDKKTGKHDKLMHWFCTPKNGGSPAEALVRDMLSESALPRTERGVVSRWARTVHRAQSTRINSRWDRDTLGWEALSSPIETRELSSKPDLILADTVPSGPILQYGPAFELQWDYTSDVRWRQCVRCEVPLMKPYTSYTVGFADVMIGGDVTIRTTYIPRFETGALSLCKYTRENLQVSDAEKFSSTDVLVELKAHPVSYSDVLRQMNLYRKATPNENGSHPYRRHVVVTAFEPEQTFRDMLGRENIRVFACNDLVPVWKRHFGTSEP